MQNCNISTSTHLGQTKHNFHLVTSPMPDKHRGGKEGRREGRVLSELETG
jgi:hypothetical protein